MSRINKYGRQFFQNAIGIVHPPSRSGRTPALPYPACGQYQYSRFGEHLRTLFRHIHNFFDSGVVNAKELVSSGNHIHLVWLTLGTFAVKKPESGFVVML